MYCMLRAGLLLACLFNRWIDYEGGLPHTHGKPFELGLEALFALFFIAQSGIWYKETPFGGQCSLFTVSSQIFYSFT